MARILLLLPRADHLRDVSQKTDYIRQRTRGRDRLQQSKGRVAEDSGRVRGSPAKAGDSPGGELLDPLEVVGRVRHHLVEHPVALEGGVRVQRRQRGGVHQVVAQLALALPRFGAAQ